MRVIFVLYLCLIATGCSALDINQLMERYLWRNRVVLVFSESENNQDFKNFNAQLKENKSALLERDVMVWQIVDGAYVKMNGETLPHAIAQNFFIHYGIPVKGAHIVLLGKDGGEKMKSELPFSIDQLFQIIDSMPMRLQEMRGKNE